MPEREERKLAAIMFTDMVAYSALTQQDEARPLALLDEHNRLLRALFSRHGGQEVKTTGDGFMVAFGSALEAARCAVGIQNALAERNASALVERRIQVRVGIHVGDVVQREGDLFGDSVNIASRIVGLAEPGAICITEPVVAQVQNKIDEPILRLGRGELKNIRVPVAIYRIVLPGEKKPLPFVAPLGFRLRQRRARLIAVALTGAILLAAVSLWESRRIGSRSGTPEGPRIVGRAKHRIAVLPFEMISPDPKRDAYIADGMTEELISRLSSIGDLEVIPRESVMRYKKERGKTIPQIGGELRVRTVVTGSVRPADSRDRRGYRWDPRGSPRGTGLYSNYVSPYNIALTCVGLDDRQQALDWLQTAYDERDTSMVYLKVEPRFDRLRSDPRFTALLKRVGLQQ